MKKINGKIDVKICKQHFKNKKIKIRSLQNNNWIVNGKGISHKKKMNS